MQTVCTYIVLHEITSLLENVVALQLSENARHYVNTDWLKRLNDLMNRVRNILSYNEWTQHVNQLASIKDHPFD